MYRFLVFLACMCAPVASLHPVIIVNGLAGSVMKARLNKTTAPRFFCSKKSDWFTIYFQITEMLPGAIDCFNDNMKLHYDEASGSFHNTPGVELDTHVDFGNVSSLTYIDPSLRVNAFLYFEPLVETLQAQFGYETGINLHGAPYDWRRAPDSLGDYYKLLRGLIEETVRVNQAPAHLITHSMGGPVILHFLNEMSRDWKDRYIRSWVAMAPPFEGAAKTVLSYVSGYNLGIPLVAHDGFYEFQKTIPSGIWLFPRENSTVISTPTKNYTGSDAAELLKDLKLAPFDKIGQTFLDMTLGELRAPYVDLVVMYGTGTPTEVSYHYDSLLGSPARPPTHTTYGCGDRVVSSKSVRRAESFFYNDYIQREHYRTVFESFQGADHAYMVHHEDILNSIIGHLESYMEETSR